MTRPMAFAGTWYPRHKAACARAIEGFAGAGGDTPSAKARFGVVPHAGWAYSGPLAGRVFQGLALADAAPQLVVVLGGHLLPGHPVVAMAGEAWATPFGPMPLHQGFLGELHALNPVRVETEHQHRPDNSVELQLPFARYWFPRAELLVLRVPPSALALQLGELLAGYLERTGLRAVLAASTDLTHYGPGYGFSPHGQGAAALRWVREENDPAFLHAVEGGNPARIIQVAQERRNACSAGAVAALSLIAGRQGARFEPLEYTTSADIQPGGGDNFVGYMSGVYR